MTAFFEGVAVSLSGGTVAVVLAIVPGLAELVFVTCEDADDATAERSLLARIETSVSKLAF